MRFASVTDYEKNYSTGYYGHAENSASFDTHRLPMIIAGLAKAASACVVDIGGGNGRLGQELKALGIACATVDVADRQGEDYIRADLSSADDMHIQDVAARIRDILGGRSITTCFDVLEHIDIEDLPHFIYNLGFLCDDEIILSVSTRPSSRGNRYHSTVLPIDTWNDLFRVLGFDVFPVEELNATRSGHKFSGSDEILSVVSHWQRRNPFNDHVSHQHYLHLRKKITGASRWAFYDHCAGILDFGYRLTKRDSLEGAAHASRNLVYSVNFIQDWSFARSIMDVVPSENFKVVLRNDIVAPEYVHFIRNFCIRTGVEFSETRSVDEGERALERWREPNALFVTATEGLVSSTHLMNSLLTLAARRAGYVTLSMQHGINVVRHLSYAAEYVGSWEAAGGHSLEEARRAESGWQVVDMGSPKFFDALQPIDSDVFAHRFGGWTRAFRKRILIGLNLHWRIGEGGDAIYRWLEAVAARYSDILFVLRPHPDDYTIFENTIPAGNVLVLDEIVLNTTDWPVSRIVKSVDAVITTFSTLLVDAIAAETAVYLFPTDFATIEAYHLPLSLPVAKMTDLTVLTSEEMRNGLLPSGLAAGDLRDPAWFEPSRTFFKTLLSLKASAGSDRFALAERDVLQALHIAMRYVNLDANPHGDRSRVSEGLKSFQVGAF